MIPSLARIRRSPVTAAGLTACGALLLLVSAGGSTSFGLALAAVGLGLLATAVVLQGSQMGALIARRHRDQARLSALLNVMETLHSGRALGPTLETVFRQLTACYNADLAGLWLARPDSPQEQRLVEGTGLDAPELERRVREMLIDAAESREGAFPLRLEAGDGLAEEREAAGYRLRLESECGYLLLGRKGAPFEPDEVSLLGAMGRDLAAALRGVRHTQQTTRQAERDPLTGLASHRTALRRLDQEVSQARRAETGFSLILLDLDNFSLYNQTYGSSAGDELLKRSAEILQKVTRDSDVVSRFGGDEFLVIQPHTDREMATRAAQRIVSALGKEKLVCGDSDRLPFTFSIGIAGFPEDGDKPTDLLAAAASRVNRSRTEGGSRVTVEVGTDYRSALADNPSFDLFQALLQAIDNKDGYTLHHSQEVTQYALQIAGAMGLPEETLKCIATSGILHDVGKIGVPDSILRKPGRLTPEERKTMEQHPAFGALLVGALPGMEQVNDGVRYHHERWDGNGYPDGLAGEQIPLLGRIMAVADVFSAMTTTRPYRKGLTEEQALDEITRGLGTQFDPQIGKLFVEVRRKESGAAKPKRQSTANGEPAARKQGHERRKPAAARVEQPSP